MTVVCAQRSPSLPQTIQPELRIFLNIRPFQTSLCCPTQIQDPDIVERRQTRRRRLAQSSTQRGSTAAEIEDQQLNQQHRIQIHDMPRSRIQQQQTLDRQQQLQQTTPPRQTPTVRKTPSPAKPKPKRGRLTKAQQHKLLSSAPMTVGKRQRQLLQRVRAGWNMSADSESKK